MKNAHGKARVDALMAAGQYGEAEAALLAIIADEPDCAPAWQKLGIAYLRLGEPAKAVPRFAAAVRLHPGDFAAFDGLAEAHGHLGEREAARQAGRRALALKDAAQPRAQRPLAPPRGIGRQVIAFSLFGAEPRYCETAILNATAAARLFPGWVCRFYADASVPADVLRRLRAAGAEIQGAQAELPGTMWRFLALDDPEAAVVLCRDADSLISAREAAMVGTWLVGGRPFHIIRDYFTHTELILAGLFGARGGVLPPLLPMMRAWLAQAGPVQRWTDQYFLREAVWPLVRDVALTHDAWFGCGSHCAPVEIVADPRDHVGANHGSVTMELRPPLPEGTALDWWLEGAEGPVTSRYAGVVRAGAHRIAIPRHHARLLQAGQCRVAWEARAA